MLRESYYLDNNHQRFKQKCQISSHGLNLVETRYKNNIFFPLPSAVRSIKQKIIHVSEITSDVGFQKAHQHMLKKEHVKWKCPSMAVGMQVMAVRLEP